MVSTSLAEKVKAAAAKILASQSSPTTSLPPKTTSTTPTATATAASTNTTAKANREAERAKFTGWDNDPAVRTLQEKWWNIYVDTGRKDTPEQIAIHAEAEKTRTYNNPMYGGLPSGPVDWMDAAKITPPSTTPGADQIEGGIDSVLNPSQFGSYLKAGVGIVVLMFVVSMFRGR